MTPTWYDPGLRGHNLLSNDTQVSPFAVGSWFIPTRDLYLKMTESALLGGHGRAIYFIM